MKENKLHIGVGNAYLDGWLNLDIFSNCRADIYSSALAIPYPRESFELIYACHILEHFNRHLIMSALTHWKDLLIPGGILRLSVPNFDAIIRYYQNTGNLKNLLGLLYGGQNSLLNEHHIIFNENLLSEYLHKVGFKDIRFWDWINTIHAQVDDYSQAYLPHMDKQNGLIMSLNMEATK